MVTAIIFTFVACWNEFAASLVILTTAENQPLSVALTKFVGQYDSAWQYVFGVSVVAIVPVVRAVRSDREAAGGGPHGRRRQVSDVRNQPMVQLAPGELEHGADGRRGRTSPDRSQRWRRLLDVLADRGRLSVTEGAALLGVSEATVRRDFTSLASQQLVTRTHGGVVATSVAYDLPAQVPSRRRRRQGPDCRCCV